MSAEKRPTAGMSTQAQSNMALSLTVSKPPSLTLKCKVSSASELALYSLLNERHKKYLQKLCKKKEEAKTFVWNLEDKGENCWYGLFVY